MMGKIALRHFTASAHRPFKRTVMSQSNKADIKKFFRF